MDSLHSDIERYMASNDPDFEKKAADIIGLYLNPLAHAAVFCVDEKTAIRALDRKDLVLPLSLGRAERHGFEYFRHGTLSLYGAFNTKTGEVLGKTAARHTAAEFAASLADIVIDQLRVSATSSRAGYSRPSLSEPKAHVIHPSVEQIAPHREVEICRSIVPYQYTISWYRPLNMAT